MIKRYCEKKKVFVKCKADIAGNVLKSESSKGCGSLFNSNKTSEQEIFY